MNKVCDKCGNKIRVIEYYVMPDAHLVTCGCITYFMRVKDYEG